MGSQPQKKVEVQRGYGARTYGERPEQFGRDLGLRPAVASSGPGSPRSYGELQLSVITRTRSVVCTRRVLMRLGTPVQRRSE